MWSNLENAPDKQVTWVTFGDWCSGRRNSCVRGSSDMNSNADWKLYEEYRDLLFRINRDLMLNCRRLCGPGSGEKLVCFRPKKFGSLQMLCDRL